jgi:peptidoglycan hydrolase CwlO-like protein
MATSKTYVVKMGALSLVNGEAKYMNNLVTADELGDQVDRHLKNDAIREATPQEVRAGVANPVGVPTLEEQIEDNRAQIESANARIVSLQQQIKERDARASKAETVVKK